MLIANRKFNDGGTTYEPGDRVDVSASRADYLKRKGLAKDAEVKKTAADGSLEDAIDMTSETLPDPPSAHPHAAHHPLSKGKKS